MKKLPRLATLVLMIGAALSMTPHEALPCPGDGCTNTTEANMSANPSLACRVEGDAHTITVNARDLDGMTKIEISLGDQTFEPCPYDPPTTSWKTCTTTWSSVGKDPGLYTFIGRVYDTCGDTYDWAGNANVYILGGPITANDSCGKKLVLYNPAAISVQDTYSASSDVPSGTTYSWTIDRGADKAEIVSGATSATCSVRAKAASTSVNDVRIKLTYTKSGVSCSSYLGTTVQKPTSLTRQDLGYDIRTCNPIGNMRRCFRDTVYDQFGSTVAHATWDESWTGGCDLAEGDSETGCDGVMIGDDQWYRWNFDCTAGNDLWCTDDQTVNVSGWGCLLRYRRWDYLGPTSNPHIDFQNLGCP